MRVLVTGSSGLVGSEAVRFYDGNGHTVVGIDNNMRAEFFGPAGDTSWNLQKLQRQTTAFEHHNIDIRDRVSINAIFAAAPFDLVIHSAAQPSHDKACEIPLIDFEVNAMGTLNLLEATRQHCPEAVFCFLSTNKVYGDAPNELPLDEGPTRYDYAHAEDHDGIDETCRIDQCLHSIFGVSKTAADLAVQEYGRYFGLRTGIFRCGCITGASHSGVPLHGFLNYLVKAAVARTPYTVIGYKGKQVRDNIHAADLVAALEAFRQNPRPGEVYNLGGGRENSTSVLEAIKRLELLTGNKFNWRYEEKNRIGDHICYITNLKKFRSHYPAWTLAQPLDALLEEMVSAEQERTK